VKKCDAGLEYGYSTVICCAIEKLITSGLKYNLISN